MTTRVGTLVMDGHHAPSVHDEWQLLSDAGWLWVRQTNQAFAELGEAIGAGVASGVGSMAELMQLPAWREHERWMRTVEYRALMMEPEQAAFLYTLQRTRIRRRQRKGR